VLPFGGFEVNPVLPDPILVYPLVLLSCQLIPISTLSGIELLVKIAIPFRQAVSISLADLVVGDRVSDLHSAPFALVPIFGLVVRFNLLASNCIHVVACESFRHLGVDRVVIPFAFRQLHLSNYET
jgi:hypothetical protein